MTRQKHLLILLVSAFISCSLYSQRVFRDGYIVKNSGETFTGLIGYNPDNRIPSACLFKRFDIAYEITYGPTQLKSFGYKNGKRYESHETGGKFSFFETLVKGNITVYKKGSKYYLRKGDLPPAEIREGKNSWIVEGIQKDFATLNELMKYLTSGFKIDIPENLVMKNDLVPVVASYNKVSGNSFIVYNRTFSEKDLTVSAWRSGANRNRLSVLGGINNYTLNVKSSEDNIYIPDPSRVSCPMLGFSYERVISKQSDKFIFRADLIYMKQDFYTYSERKLIDGSLSRDDAYFNFSVVKLPLLFQYSFTGKRIIPFINGGLSGMYIFNEKYFHISETQLLGNDIRTYEDHDMVFNSSEISGSVGAGFKIRVVNNTVLNLEGRLEYGTGAFNKSFPADGSFTQHSIQSSIIIGLSF
jgi:hypothetical protein